MCNSVCSKLIEAKCNDNTLIFIELFKHISHFKHIMPFYAEHNFIVVIIMILPMYLRRLREYK